MIVEDNDLNMKLFRDLLQANGFRTLHLREGRNVLETARRERPNLILMDVQLPEVSGVEIIRWLKSDGELKSIPVVAITAFAMKGDEERIRASGCNDYLSKPISISLFLSTVQRFLNEQS